MCNFRIMPINSCVRSDGYVCVCVQRSTATQLLYLYMHARVLCLTKTVHSFSTSCSSTFASDFAFEHTVALIGVVVGMPNVETTHDNFHQTQTS